MHVDVAQPAQQGDIVWRQAQRIDQHSLCGAQIALRDQVTRITQGFVRCVSGGINGAAQHVRHQVAIACAFMGLCHQAHCIGIIRSLPQNRAQGDDGLVGTITLDQPAGPYFHRFDLGFVLFQNFLDQGPCADPVVGRLQHPGQHDHDVAPLVRRLHPIDKLFHFGNRRIALAQIEAEPCPQGGQPLYRRRIACNDPVQLDPGGLWAARLGKETDIESDVIGIARLLIRAILEEFLGSIGITLRHVPAHQGGWYARIIGESHDHILELRLNFACFTQLAENAEANCVEFLTVGGLGKRGIDGRQGGDPVLSAHQIINNDPPGNHQVGVLGHKRLRFGHRLTLCRSIIIRKRIAIAYRGIDCLHQTIIGGQRRRCGPMLARHIPVVGL